MPPYAPSPVRFPPKARLYQPTRKITSPDGDVFEDRLVYLPDNTPIRNTQPGNLAFAISLLVLGAFLALAVVGIVVLCCRGA